MKISPEVSLIRSVIRKRLMDENRIKAQDAELDRMLLTLAHAGYVTLLPEPPREGEAPAELSQQGPVKGIENRARCCCKALGVSNQPAAVRALPGADRDADRRSSIICSSSAACIRSTARSSCSISASPIATSDCRRLESVLEMPRSVLRYVRVPWPEDLPPGPLAMTRLDADLISRGLMIAKPPPVEGEEEEDDDWSPWREEEERLADLERKAAAAVRRPYPEVNDVTTQSVWAAGELLRFGGNFNKFVQSRDLVKQEGILFRHLLRLDLAVRRIRSGDAGRHGARTPGKRSCATSPTS